MKKILYSFLLLSASAIFPFTHSTAQSYLGTDGGFEGSATIDNTNTYSAAQSGKWAKANTNQTIANETGTVRSGTNSIRLNNSSTTGARLWSPNIAVSSVTTSVTLQYYRYVANTSNANENQEGVLTSVSETLSGTYATGTAGTWTKATYTRSSSTFTSLSGIIMFRKKGTGGDMFVDDVVLYAGAVDNTAPNSPGTVTISNATTSSLDLSWVAASGGVDNGGYMVVRYTTTPNANNDPNVNGVYAVGNTHTNGTGSLTGTIRYVGTGTSFTDNTGLSAGTTYYYKVYTFDKAYNYSSESEANGTTTAAGATIAAPTISTNTPPFCFDGTSTISFNVDFTSSGTFTSNTYTAELSDASGSFSSPQSIGTLSSNANSGTISATIPTTPTLTYGTGYKIRVTASSPTTTGTASTVFTINRLATINTQPADQLSCSASSASFSVTASTNGAALTYQWQGSATGSSGWLNVINGTPSGSTYTNENTASLSVTANTDYYYRCVVSSGTCSVNTNAAQLTISGSAPSISAHPTNQTGITGSASGSANFSVTVASGTPTYDWQYSANGSTGWASVINGTPANVTYTNATTATLSVSNTASASAGTYYYRCVVTTGGCNATSNSATLTLSVPDYVSLSGMGVSVTEKFDVMASTGTGSTMPTGWYFSESGSNANSTYSAGTGSSTTGDTYSFGSSSSDRCPGNIRSSNLITTIGGKFRNNTGQTITSLKVIYYGEQWRLGALSRADQLDFQYSTSATALSTGTYTDFNSLDFTSPVQAGTVGALDGNATANRTKKEALITGLSIANGADFWFRWNDMDASGADDGIGFDDFTIIPYGSATTNVSSPSGSYNGFNLTIGTSTMSADMQITGNLNLESGSTLAIGSNTLTINGTVSGTGVISGGPNANLVISGTGEAGSLLMDQSSAHSSNRLNNLTVNIGTTPATGSITLGNTAEVTGTVDLQNGTLNTGGSLTLISDALGTARIGKIPSTADISGNVTVQRYVASGTVATRRYRMFSSPNQNFTWSQLIDNMFLSGTGGSANGFDSTTTNSSSCFTYQENPTGTRGWKAASNITNSLSAGTGTLVFLRGDRTLASPDWFTPGSYPAQNAVTIDFTSQPVNKGTITPTLTWNTTTGGLAEDGWNLVGNPYPSQIDWSSTGITKTNIESSFYVYDPSTGSYTSASSGIIALGQAFFVHADGNGAPAISFTEDCKASGAATAYFKTAVQEIRLKVVKDAFNSDMASIAFDGQFNQGFDGQEDARKYPNTLINFGFTVNGTRVQHNRTPLGAWADTFALFIDAPNGNYTMQLSGIQAALPASKFIYLKDLFTNNVTDLRTVSQYAFTISAQAGASGQRFQLIVGNPQQLPVKWSSFTASRQGELDVKLNWGTASEVNASHFIVERSTGGADNFEEIATIKCKGNATTSASYSFIDKNAFSKQVSAALYKIKQVDISGAYTYSEIVAVRRDESENSSQLLLYPNPASGSVGFMPSSEMQGMSHIDVYNIVGKHCMSADTFVSKGQEIRLDVSSLQPGIYILKTIHSQSQKQTVARFKKE